MAQNSRQTNVESNPRRSKRKTSVAWKFFRVVSYDDKEYSRCDLCGKEFVVHKNKSGTGNMLSHLKYKHGEVDAVQKAFSLDAKLNPKKYDSIISSVSYDDIEDEPTTDDNEDVFTPSGKNSSQVWRFFKIVHFGDRQCVRCTFCGTDYVWHNSFSGTGNMRKHLGRKHMNKARVRKYLLPSYNKNQSYWDSPTCKNDILLKADNVDTDFTDDHYKMADSTIIKFDENEGDHDVVNDDDEDDDKLYSDNDNSLPTYRQLQNKSQNKVILDKEQLKNCIKVALLSLCRSQIQFNTNVSVEALIGVTVDEKDVTLININEGISSENGAKDSDELHEELPKRTRVLKARKRGQQIQAKTIKSPAVKKGKRSRIIKENLNISNQEISSHAEAEMSLSMEAYDEPPPKVTVHRSSSQQSTSFEEDNKLILRTVVKETSKLTPVTVVRAKNRYRPTVQKLQQRGRRSRHKRISYEEPSDLDIDDVHDNHGNGDSNEEDYFPNTEKVLDLPMGDHLQYMRRIKAEPKADLYDKINQPPQEYEANSVENLVNNNLEYLKFGWSREGVEAAYQYR